MIMVSMVIDTTHLHLANTCSPDACSPYQIKFWIHKGIYMHLEMSVLCKTIAQGTAVASVSCEGICNSVHQIN